MTIIVLKGIHGESPTPYTYAWLRCYVSTCICCITGELTTVWATLSGLDLNQYRTKLNERLMDLLGCFDCFGYETLALNLKKRSDCTRRGIRWVAPGQLFLTRASYKRSPAVLLSGISNYLTHSFSPQRKQCHTEGTTNLIQSIFSLVGFLAFPSEISVESRFIKRSPLCEVSCITRNNEKSAIILPRWCDNWNI